jgi:hypothetical protein
MQGIAESGLLFDVAELKGGRLEAVKRKRYRQAILFLI